MKFLKNRHPKRFAKFSIIGSFNFLVDMIILNSLSFLTGFNKGVFAALFSVISFTVGNVSSYQMNKRWTFKDNRGNSRYKIFLSVSMVGVLINVVVVYSLTSHINQPYFSDTMWLNVSKVIATSFVVFFNYFSYKKWVFKS